MLKATLTTMSKISLTSYKLSKSNTVNKEGNKIRKGAGTMSSNYSNKIQTDDASYSDGKYKVPEASDIGDDNDSDEEDQYEDTDTLENGAHHKIHLSQMSTINHVPTAGFT